MSKRPLLTEADVIQAWRRGDTQIRVTASTLITPAARDAARARGIALVTDGATAPASAGPAASRPGSAQVSNPRRIAIGADHGGFALKTALVDFLKSRGYQVEDVGTFGPDPVDYPDIAESVCQRILEGRAERGIVIDGAGIGSAMVANKIPGIRAACCNDIFSAVNSREHNGANVLTLGGRMIGDVLAQRIVETWLNTPFGGGRHQRRLDKIAAVEARYRKNS